MYTDQELKEILQRSDYKSDTIKRAAKFLSDFSPQRSPTAIMEIVKGVMSNVENQKRVTQ